MTIQSDMAALPGPILVIGAGGFIGANLLRGLLEVRDDVFGARYRSGAWRLEDVPEERLVRLDLLNPASVREVLGRIRPRVVFHCAAHGAYSFQRDERRIFETNVEALAELLNLMADGDPAAFVHAGTSSEYGLNSAGPDEDAPRLPDSPYAVSKSAAADLIAYHGLTQGLPCVNLRLYSAYGPYEDSFRLIPNLVEQGLQGRLPPLSNPDTSRDFVYIDDATNAFVAAAVGMSERIQGRSFNIGTGRKLTVRQVVEIAKAQFGIDEEPVFGRLEPRPWDRADWFASPEKARQELGWQAEVPFEEGLVRTADWWRSFLVGRDFKTLSANFRPAPQEKNSLSAVVACYKEERAIPVMYERLSSTCQKLGLDYEIIFVNDGSPQNDEEAIRKLSAEDPRVLGVTHARNFGSQAAFRSGMALASKEACVLLDGDLQDPPELIERFVPLWRQGYDVVYGRRIKREMKPHQEWMYKGFYRLFSALSDTPVPKDAGEFALMDRRVMRWVMACSERDSFLRGLRAWVGFRQTGVDYVRPDRMFGRSTNNLLSNLEWAKRGIFSFSSKPLNMLTATGFGLFGVSALLVLLTLLLALIGVWRPGGTVVTMLTILFLGSLNLLGLALVGEYVGKIAVETRQRPPYIRRNLIAGGRIEPTPAPEDESQP